jgi:hypothetical protein
MYAAFPFGDDAIDEQPAVLVAVGAVAQSLCRGIVRSALASEFVFFPCLVRAARVSAAAAVRYPSGEVDVEGAF